MSDPLLKLLDELAEGRKRNTERGEKLICLIVVAVIAAWTLWWLVAR